MAAQPWRDPAVARADLDAFADAAAAFANDEEEPTLGAFLAYLTAAEAEEFGLESGQPSGANAVTLTTVHAAKGLQWAAVVVPGLAAGAAVLGVPREAEGHHAVDREPPAAPVRPARRCGGPAGAARPEEASREKFTGACSARELAEERRLAYVAVTRAAYWVACSGYWWGEAASPLGPSAFLEEVRAACADGPGTVAHWAPPPDDGAQNPALAEPAVVSVAAAQEEQRHAAVREAATLVERELARLEEPDAGGAAGDGDGRRRAGRGGPGACPRLVPGHRPAAQRAFAAARRCRAAVPLPAQLSVSSLVTMAADPDRLAQQIRRPMPRPPAPQARRGTAFHRWLEQRFGQQRLIDPADLLGRPTTRPRIPTTPTSPCSGNGSKRGSGATAGRWTWRCRSRRWSRAARSAGGSTPCSPTPSAAVTTWSTGRPGSRRTRPPTCAPPPSSSPPTGWPGRPWPGCRWTRSGRRSTTCATTWTLRPADLLDEAGLAALIEEVPLAGQER